MSIKLKPVKEQAKKPPPPDYTEIKKLRMSNIADLARKYLEKKAAAEKAEAERKSIGEEIQALLVGAGIKGGESVRDPLLGNRIVHSNGTTPRRVNDKGLVEALVKEKGWDVDDAWEIVGEHTEGGKKYTYVQVIPPTPGKKDETKEKEDE